MKFALSKIEEQCEDSGKQRDSGRGDTDLLKAGTTGKPICLKQVL